MWIKYMSVHSFPQEKVLNFIEFKVLYRVIHIINSIIINIIKLLIIRKKGIYEIYN